MTRVVILFSRSSKRVREKQYVIATIVISIFYATLHVLPIQSSDDCAEDAVVMTLTSLTIVSLRSSSVKDRQHAKTLKHLVVSLFST